MALSRSAKYYRKNKKARDKKNAYQKEYNKKPSQVKKRVELNRINRKKGTYGNGDGKDYDHAVGRMVKASTNRGRKSGTKGDKKARGGKKK
jgi:hypothetical protein